MKYTSDHEIKRVCGHAECPNTQTGIAVNGSIMFDASDMLQHILACPVLSKKPTGMPDECSHWLRAKIIRT